MCIRDSTWAVLVMIVVDVIVLVTAPFRVMVRCSPAASAATVSYTHLTLPTSDLV